MTPTALTNLIPSVGKSSPVPSTTAAPGATSADADQFASQLATSIASATAAKPAASSTATVAAAPAAGDSSPLTALQTQIAAALNAGQSVSSVVTQLANSLATKVAAKLGISTDDARKRLEAAFTAALSPPGTSTGPPLATAQQALALAQTFLQTASVATGVATGESGQLNRLVGTDLDAEQAKATPAQTTTTPLGTAQNAQAVAASAAAGADIAALARLAAPSSSDSPLGDGRSVALPSGVEARSTGGSTLLGRVLTRAALVAPATTASTTAAPAASVSSAADDVVDALLGETSAGQSFGSATPDATAAPASAAAETASPPAATATQTVAAFLQAFTTALSSSASATTAAATLGASGKNPSPDPRLLVPGSSTTETATAFVPSVPAFSIDQASTPTSTAAPSTAAQTADPSAIVEQVLRGAFLQTNGTSSTIRLSLVPEHLGDVSVKMSVDATGNVSAHVTAQTAEAGHALTQGQAQLTRSLAEAGLKLTSFTVDVSNSGLGGNASGQQQSSQQSSTGRRTLIAGLDADAPSGDESALLAVPTFGPPIVANRTLGNYNYLA